MTETDYRGRHEAEERRGRHERLAEDGLLPWHGGDQTQPWLPSQPATWPQPVFVYGPQQQRPETPPSVVLARIFTAGLIALAAVIVAVTLLLTVALIAGPPPAQAASSTNTQRTLEQTTVTHNQRVKVRLGSDRVTIKAPDICPAEDSCRVIDNGTDTFVIERTYK